MIGAVLLVIIFIVLVLPVAITILACTIMICNHVFLRLACFLYKYDPINNREYLRKRSAK